MCSETNVQGKITSQQYTLWRWCKNIYFGEAILCLEAAHSWDQLFNRQSWSKRLRNCHPLESRLGWRCAFLPGRVPGLQKVSKNTTVGWYSPVVKLSMQLLSRRLRLRPSWFSNRKVPYLNPRAGFCGRTTKRTPPVPYSGTFNGGEGIKMIRQPFYSPNTAVTNLFLF